jgi:hypothetical protein
MSSIQQSQSWARLRVNDFPAEVKLLRESNLITDERDGNLVSLAKNSGTDQVVRCLVKNGISVYEIFLHEQNLEEFYLSLMKAGKQQAQAGQTSLPFLNLDTKS